MSRLGIISEKSTKKTGVGMRPHQQPVTKFIYLQGFQFFPVPSYAKSRLKSTSKWLIIDLRVLRRFVLYWW